MKDRRRKKAALILTILCTIAAIISALLNYLVPWLLSLRYSSKEFTKQIGIIGGADGPTSIFISGQPSHFPFTFLFALLGLLGIIYLLYLKRNGKKSDEN